MLEDVLERAKELIKYQGEVRVKVKPLKTSIARVSFRHGTITVDPSVLNLSEEEILYILVHELAHLKAGTVYHSSLFWEVVSQVFPKEIAVEMEDRIILKLRKKLV